MAKSVKVKVAKDHLERLTKASGATAIMELIWNSLDADAQNILIRYVQNPIGIEEIVISDDGHGIPYKEAEEIFGTLGGSAKKVRRTSPNQRKLHGQEGQGRYKGLALGLLMVMETTYIDRDDKLKSYTITIDGNNINDAVLSDISIVRGGQGRPGTTVRIHNVIQANASILLTERLHQQLEEKLAVYYLAYPNFQITINNYKLDFTKYIIKQDSKAVTITDDEQSKLSFNVKLLEWSLPTEKSIYLCNSSGISYTDMKLGIRTSNLHISVYIQSDYIEELHNKGLLPFSQNGEVITGVVAEAKDFARTYIRRRLHESAYDFIQDAKREGIYPYHEAPQNHVQEAQRQVFDIVALNINEYVPKFSDQETANKKLIFSLVKEALESDSKALQKILTEAVTLPKDKQEELAELLEKSSLAEITTAVKEISDRLRTLYEMKLLLLDPDMRKMVLERKHIQKIIKNNTWIFGDDYTYGVDDVNLKNVLRSHLKQLGREDFEDVISAEDNPALNDIPDFCLFKKFPRGRAGFYENLVIEIKRPSKHSGMDELEQVKRYARSISTDGRFDSSRTDWTVVLLVTEMTEDLEFEYHQEGRPRGEILRKKNLTVMVMKWIDILTDVEARHEFLKTMLNYEVTNDEEGIKLLKEKYAAYLPAQLSLEPGEDKEIQSDQNAIVRKAVS